MVEGIRAEILRRGITENDYPHSPFIPYVLSGYCKAPVKVMVGGRDTYYWNSFQDFFKENYLDINESTVTVSYLEQHNRAKDQGTFWKNVQRAYLLFRTGEYISDLTLLSEDHYAILSELGCWNYNSIEKDESLGNEDSDWQPASMANLSALREICRPFSSVKNIIDAYEPDILVLLHWTDDMSPFEGLNLNRIALGCGSVALFSIEGYRTKVLWSYHPRALMTFGNDERAIAEMLARALKELS